ncbi:MAG: helix-turn-helix transcriptional regulator [Caldilineaceae bacterium]|nr:helix-turn-helix transcriptional regulator [Caldilineaceae bacterium]
MKWEFSRWLRKKRKSNQMTMEDVARLAGTSKSYIHEIENGKSAPSIDKAAAIANAFSMPLWKALKEAQE